VVANYLEAPLDVILVKKLGFPGHPELAMGAISSFGDQISVFWNDELSKNVSESQRICVLERQKDEIKKRSEIYRKNKHKQDIEIYEYIVIVDDGIATGSTMFAAIESLKANSKHKKIVVASPIGCSDQVYNLRNKVELVAVLSIP
jgi:putative phosphoribosyl transferase